MASLSGAGWTKSSTARDEPSRVSPYTDSDEPKRANVRRDLAKPRERVSDH